jgi:hypothetical protein
MVTSMALMVTIMTTITKKKVVELAVVAVTTNFEKGLPCAAFFY